MFQSTRPTRGATSHAGTRIFGTRFQSTRPTRGATSTSDSLSISSEFQSTRPTRGATSRQRRACSGGWVSIHAPHAGRDPWATASITPEICFNPRAPRGARLVGIRVSPVIDQFQSTRPTRGATASGYLTDLSAPPRSPARTCRRRSPRLHTYRSAPPPTHSPHWRYPLSRTPALSHVRFAFALLTPPAAPAGRTTASPPHAPPSASSCPPENRTASCRWPY